MKRLSPCLLAAVMCVLVVAGVAIMGPACGGPTGGADSTTGETGDVSATGAGDAGSADATAATSPRAAPAATAAAPAGAQILVPALVAEPGLVTGAWSAPLDGLEAALRLDGSEVVSGTDVVIVAVFRNSGDVPVTIPADPYFTINISLDGVPVADAIGKADIPVGTPALPPGEERAYEIDGLRTDVFGAGIYALGGAIGELQLARVTVTAK